METLRILSLEDNMLDLRIIEDTLEAGDIRAQIINVKSRSTFLESLEREAFDLFFLDYNLPGYNGVEAIKEIRNRELDKPVIIISGTIGDERAIECIKNGATDYVLKDNVIRLVPVIRRALDEYATRLNKKKAEQELFEYSEKLKAMNLELTRKNRELDDANRKLKQLDTLKSEFIARAAHELRTPLTSIRGFTDTLLADDIELQEPDRRQFLGIISKESRRLSDLLDTLLDIARADSGSLTLNKMTFDICELVKSIIEHYKFPDGITVRVHDKYCGQVSGDRARITRVVSNILDNAVRHLSPEGVIDITVKRNDGETLVSIYNNGPSIPENELERIFDRFYRLKEQVKESKGSGMGLTLAREIINLHGGRIWAESQPQQGVTFHFTIPTAEF